MNTDEAGDLARWKRTYAAVSWTGIALRLALAFALIFLPRGTLPLLRTGGDPITWPQFCGVLLMILAVFSIPPALDSYRFRLYAWLDVVPGRASVALLCAAAVFFLGAPKVFLLGGLLTAVIGAAEAWALLRLANAETSDGSVAGGGRPARAERFFRRFTPPALPTPPPAVLRWKKAYRWVSWAGIALNAFFFLPLIFTPHEMLEFLGADCVPVVWAQLFGVLLGVISVFYIPAAMDPDLHRLYAWLAIFPSRAAGVVFCTSAVIGLGANEAFLLGAVLDFTIGALQVLILWRLGLAERRAATPHESVPAGWRGWWPAAAVGLVMLGLLGLVGWHKLFRPYPQQLTDRTIEEYFKHGSIGAEGPTGLPYWLWVTLPTVFPEYLPRPGGYSSLGLLWEPGTELPVGFSRLKIGFDRVAINCAVCHAGSVQIPGEPRPRVIPGAPATTANILGYQRFLFSAAKDPRFDAATLLPAIARQTRLSWLDTLLYRYVLIPQTRRALREQAVKWDWSEEAGRPEWGPGRIEPFNPVKVAILEGVDANVKPGTSLGTSDMQPLWNLGAYPGRAFHWDGLNTDLREVVDSSALGDGATKTSIPRDKALRPLQDWISRNAPPPFPFKEFGQTARQDLVTRGQAVYGAECARCHAPGGELTGKVTPASGKDGVGTDPNRALMWTKEAAAAYNDYLGNLPWRFHNFRSTGGYVNVPLDGLWLRAPYLHNGSVPTLADLLRPPEERPTSFLRGLSEYDPKNVGYVSYPEYPKTADAPPAGDAAADPARAAGFRYDTSGRGNGNGGHVYGTALPAADKEALLEFLKTL